MDPDSFQNTNFSESVTSEKIDQIVSVFEHHHSGAGFALSLHDLSEIERAKDVVKNRVDVCFHAIIEKLLATRKNLIRYSGINFISIGEDCFSRNILTRWGLKPCAILGERSEPFDLSVHPVAILSDIIESDFDGYLSVENLSFIKEWKFCQNHKLNIRFNHEKGEKYASNNFDLLIKTYQRRIDNFRQRIASDGRTVFVLHVYHPDTAKCIHIKNSIRSLRKSCQSAEILMICINTWKFNQPVDSRGRELLKDETVEIVDINYPICDYVWYLPKFYQSPEGRNFEESLISIVIDIVDRWLGLEPVDPSINQLILSRIARSY